MAMESDIRPTSEMVNDEIEIWRYMDLPRFVSMLATGRLWFAKAATLDDDPWEGFCKAISLETPLPDDGPRGVIAEESDKRTLISWQQMFARMSQMSAGYCENAPNHLYVNSWCLGASESMAMWHIYGSAGTGIAVKSSVGQYKRSARFGVPSSQCMFGKVKYHSNLESSTDLLRNFSSGTIPLPGPRLWNEVLQLGFHKRSCYEYESEWRAAVYQDQRPEVTGIHEEFDLEQLISAVYVGPRSEAFFLDVVRSIMEKFIIRKPLERSTLLSPPVREVMAAWR